MKLYAISDIHLSYPENCETLLRIPPHPDDWLILAGDIGEKAEHLEFALRTLGARFARLIWVPGNHDLWSNPKRADILHGEALYQSLVALCRRYGVLTPEDPYVDWPGEPAHDGQPVTLAPLFLLYDYSFRPDDVPREDALRWAIESRVLCTDEALLQPSPYPTREAWCEARLAVTAPRLEIAARRRPLILINHFPLRQDLIRLRKIPRFSLWCGTRATEDWHTRFRARVVVSGHLHMRATDWIDGVRFEEVSLGYPEHWRKERGAAGYLREILPGPPPPTEPEPATIWHR